MATGFGNSSFGSVPFGFGDPDSYETPTNNLFEARYIDPITKDYVYNSDGSMQNMPRNRQRVTMSLLTTQTSSTTLPESFGNSVPFIQKIDDKIDSEVETRVRSALQQLIDDGSITLENVTVEEDSLGRITYTVNYIDEDDDSRTVESIKFQGVG